MLSTPYYYLIKIHTLHLSKRVNSTKLAYFKNSSLETPGCKISKYDLKSIFLSMCIVSEKSDLKTTESWKNSVFFLLFSHLFCLWFSSVLMAQVSECLLGGRTLLPFPLCFWPLCWNFPRVKISTQPGEAWVAPDATSVTRWVQLISSRDHFHFPLSCIGEGNGNPLQHSCLENPRDRGAWWAAVYGVAQSRTWPKRLSSSSSSSSRDLVAGSPILTFNPNDIIQSSFTTTTHFWGNFSIVSKFEREW